MKAILALLVAAVLSAGGLSASQDVVIENAKMKLVIGGNARAKSLVVKATGEECLDADEGLSMFTVTQERPFNNENKLTHPNRRTTYPATKVVREGDLLVVNFRLVRYVAEIKVVERPDYVLFELQGFRNADADYGDMKIDRPPAVELRLADLPVKPRTNFGDWLTEAQRTALKDPKREFHLFETAPGAYELCEIEMLPTPSGARHLRGFLFERGGQRVVACWHSAGEGVLDWALGPKNPLSNLKYVTTDLSRTAVKDAWAAAKLEDK